MQWKADYEGVRCEVIYQVRWKRAAGLIFVESDSVMVGMGKNEVVVKVRVVCHPAIRNCVWICGKNFLIIYGIKIIDYIRVM